MIRVFDIALSMVGLTLCAPLFILITILGFVDTGSPFFRQERVGRLGKPFVLIKFRSMRPGTASVATHLANQNDITRFGQLLRRTKLDELPQLWNVLKGEMSLVGPRPCLPTQNTLIAARDRLNVLQARPGITGLAQISGIDMSTPDLLAETDAHMLASLTLVLYFKYILLTVMGKGYGDRVRSR